MSIPDADEDLIVREANAALVDERVDALAALLVAVVERGGSLGFRALLTTADAKRYWHETAGAVGAGTVRMLVACRRGGGIVGTVQLHPSPWPDGPHRAEIAKLMVDPSVRRQGIAARLMDEVEQAARQCGRTLLILNTRVGDPSEALYAKRGYVRFGVVPGYLTDGERLFDKSYWYRDLSGTAGGVDPQEDTASRR